MTKTEKLLEDILMASTKANHGKTARQCILEVLERALAEQPTQEPVAWNNAKQKTLNEWFLSLPEPKQHALIEDKWVLAGAAFEAGLALAEQPAQEPAADGEPMYYLQDTRGYVGNCPLWWGLNSSGYTTDLLKAQKYTFAEVMSQHRSRNSDLPWLCSEIDAIQRPTIDAQDMHKIRSADGQRAALEAAHGNTKE